MTPVLKNTGIDRDLDLLLGTEQPRKLDYLMIRQQCLLVFCFASENCALFAFCTAFTSLTCCKIIN